MVGSGVPTILVVLVLGLATMACDRSADPEVSGVASVSPTPSSTLVPTAAPTSAAPSSPAGPATPPPTGPLPTSAWTGRRAAPLALTEVAAAAFGGQIWVAGGFDEAGGPVAAVQVYDPGSDTWSRGPDLPEPVHHAALVSTGDRLVLLGGYTARDLSVPTDAVHVLDAATGRWADGTPLPAPRAAGAAAYDGDRILYGGGVGPQGVTGEVMVLAAGQWTGLGSLSRAREHLAAASDAQGSVFFLAGRNPGNLADVDMVVGTQLTRVGAVPTARGGVAGFYSPQAGACVVGGEAPEGTFAQVECLSDDGIATTLPPLAQARHGLGAVVLDGIAFVLLGGPQPGLTVSAAIEALPLAGALPPPAA